MAVSKPRMRRRRRILSTAVPLATMLGAVGTGPVRTRAEAAPVVVASRLPFAVPVMDPTAALETALLGLAPGLRREALRPALEAWERLRADGRASRSVLTVIDYGLPSTRPRLWVFDLGARSLLYHELVAHGRGSGDDLATAFSNVEGSHMTSLGTFLTGEPYVGSNGYSLRLFGIDPGVNDRAAERAIVVHGAPYVDESVAAQLGRLGRSWGCPALRPAIARELIDVIRGGSVLYAWHPATTEPATAEPATAKPAAPDTPDIADPTTVSAR